jgi:D-threo-aldose 1-dehydrogenase
LAKTLPALARMRDEGLIRAVGVGSKSVDALVAAVRSGHIDVVMVAGRYTLLEQPAAVDLLPECIAHGVEAVAVGVYNSGALSHAHPHANLYYEYGPMPDEVFRRVLLLAEECERAGSDLPTTALHFPLRHPAVSSVLVGARTPEQLRENADRFHRSVPNRVWDLLQERELLTNVGTNA